MTMLVVTHETVLAREALEIGWLADEGRIVEEAPGEVLDRPRQERTKRFLRRLLQMAHSLEELLITEEGEVE